MFLYFTARGNGKIAVSGIAMRWNLYTKKYNHNNER
jgi:hypothetical protein